MARRARRTPEPDRPALAVPRSQAEARITEFQGRGQALAARGRSLGSADAYSEWRGEFNRWHEVGEEMLRSFFTTDGPAEEFGMAATPTMVMGPTDVGQELEWRLEAIADGLNKLEGLKERLEFMPLSDSVAEAGAGGQALTDAPPEDARVFVVHGRNEEVKARVARLLEKTGPSHEVLILSIRLVTPLVCVRGC